MPRPRKTTSQETVSLPSSGTQSDINHLSTVLGLPPTVCTAIMTCQGQGVRSRRSDAAAAAEPAPAMAAMNNVWGDWMNEEMTAAVATSGSTPAVSAAAEGREEKPTTTTSSTSAPAAATVESTGPREYILPVEAPVSKPGILLQTGTLDATIPGRSSIPKQLRSLDLECPTVLFPGALGGKTFVRVVSSPTACHSVGITKGESMELFVWACMHMFNCRLLTVLFVCLFGRLMFPISNTFETFHPRTLQMAKPTDGAATNQVN